MSDSAPPYLEKYGREVIGNGYLIVPIVQGSKAPGLGYPAKKWSAVVADEARLATWISKGFAANGIGVLAGPSPGVDIDCYDETVVAHMHAFITARLGHTIERVGEAPKTMLVFRAEEPFAKVTSNDYLDGHGRKARLEILGDGQQFVALAIHPDTKKPYRWKDKRGVHNTPIADLPVITRDDAVAIKEEFERLARERNWPLKKTLQRPGGTGPGRIDYDNPFLQDAHKVDLNPADLRARLQLVENSEDYETWTQIGMSLYHQFDGTDEGMTLWDEWSSTAMNYDPEAVRSKWPTFEIEGKGRAPVTAKLILKLAKDAEEELISTKLEASLTAISAATSIRELTEACMPIKSLAFDKPTRGMLAGRVKDRYKEITKTAMTISDARDMVRFENPENRNVPAWLSSFIYVQMDKIFYNLKTRQALDTQSFDQSFGRFMLTRQDQLEGRSTPETPASHVALHRYQIPTAYQRMYMPGEDDLFSINGTSYVNTYNENGLPEVPEIISLSGRIAIETVKKHMVHLFANQHDRDLLLDWFAWIVQTQQRINWCPIIQGVSSDGKSWFYDLLAAVLGMENVIIIPGTALNEKYTAWAEGHLLVVIEEVRLHGKDRYAAVNNLKPFISNPRVPIRRMQTDTYNVINRTSYLALTNFRDGIPADAGDTRYFPLFSRWQNLDRLKAFKLANPDYYINLFGAIQEAGALRKWFLQREIGTNFHSWSRAPESSHRDQMIELSRDDETTALIEALNESKRLDFSRTLLNSALVTDQLTGRGAVAPYGRRLNMLLSEFGFTPLGQVKINGENGRWWTMDPESFTKLEGDKTITDTDAVRQFLDTAGL